MQRHRVEAPHQAAGPVLAPEVAEAFGQGDGEINLYVGDAPGRYRGRQAHLGDGPRAEVGRFQVGLDWRPADAHARDLHRRRREAVRVQPVKIHVAEHLRALGHAIGVKPQRDAGQILGGDVGQLDVRRSGEPSRRRIRSRPSSRRWGGAAARRTNRRAGPARARPGPGTDGAVGPRAGSRTGRPPGQRAGPSARRGKGTRAQSASPRPGAWRARARHGPTVTAAVTQHTTATRRATVVMPNLAGVSRWHSCSHCRWQSCWYAGEPHGDSGSPSGDGVAGGGSTWGASAGAIARVPPMARALVAASPLPSALSALSASLTSL